MAQRFRRIWLCVVVLSLVASTQSRAISIFYDPKDLTGGLFQYNLVVDNTGGTEPISGLLVLHGNSAFGLDATSVISAPQDIAGNPAADWFFFPPDPGPPLVDSLDYFSLNPAGDVPINGVQGGFFFTSLKDPNTIGGDDFRVDLVGSISGAQIFQGRAQLVPEPSTIILLGVSTLVLLVYIWHCRRQVA
jgi:hypothetical protein